MPTVNSNPKRIAAVDADIGAVPTGTAETRAKAGARGGLALVLGIERNGDFKALCESRHGCRGSILRGHRSSQGED